MAELKEAIFSQPSDKTPGPDGFPIDFYKQFWTYVKPSLFQEIKAFFHSGSMSSDWNHSFIALIPKVENPITSNHFRPIGLCNSTYKIISKLMANRLKKFLPKLVSKTQRAFVEGRLIHDNILAAHEIFQDRKSVV